MSKVLRNSSSDLLKAISPMMDIRPQAKVLCTPMAQPGAGPQVLICHKQYRLLGSCNIG